MNVAVERWLFFAEEDLRGAEVMFRAELYNLACFHAQQCVEKILKGLLVHLGKRPPRTHAITELLNLSSETGITDLQNELITLDDFYIPTRYPDALPGMLPDGLPRKDDAETALNLARITLQQIKQILDAN